VIVGEQWSAQMFGERDVYLSFRTSRALFLPPPFGLFGGLDRERFEFACEDVQALVVV
jgi:hypothetical protein